MDDKMIYLICKIIIIVAAINLGIVGLIEKDVIFYILGLNYWITRLLQIIIGAAGVYVALKDTSLI